MTKIKEPHKILSIAIIGKLQRRTYSCRETAPFSEELGCNTQDTGDRRPATTVQQKASDNSAAEKSQCSRKVTEEDSQLGGGGSGKLLATQA